MKKDLHPSNYRDVVFKDMSNGETFITRSTVASKETIELDGVTYPLVKLEITSSSHPFFPIPKRFWNGTTTNFTLLPTKSTTNS
mgnify:CR=1 FL=1